LRRVPEMGRMRVYVVTSSIFAGNGGSDGSDGSDTQDKGEQ